MGGQRQRAGAANLVAYQKVLARNDISLTHTIIHPTIDKAKGDVPEPGNDVALHKVADTEHGIVVRGARILATLAPFADEIAVYPAIPLPEGTDAYALSFCIPMNTPGLKIHLPRQLRDAAEQASTIRCPSRFDEQDAFVIFDDVEVPRDRVFIDANLVAYNTVMTTGWYPNIMQQTMIRAQTKLEFAYGLANRMAEAINDASPATQQMLGEIWTYAEFARAAIHSAEIEALRIRQRRVVPRRPPARGACAPRCRPGSRASTRSSRCSARTICSPRRRRRRSPIRSCARSSTGICAAPAT